ncbi:MAG: hypothetical protein VW891_02530 [Novosphingobium sp.]
MLSATSIAHGVRAPVTAYALCENARRARLGLSRKDYAAQMGELFAPFTDVAAANDYSAAALQPMSAEEIVTVSERNRMIAEPYPLKLVSRDQVNQAAAVLVMSAKAARDAGISQDRWVYLHGAALTSEREILDRPDIGAYPAANAAIASALGTASVSSEDIDFFDFYSCFPIPVFTAAIDGLELSPQDPRKLTVTGGLPYFGGAGNNYSTLELLRSTNDGQTAPQPAREQRSGWYEWRVPIEVWRVRALDRTARLARLRYPIRSANTRRCASGDASDLAAGQGPYRDLYRRVWEDWAGAGDCHRRDGRWRPLHCAEPLTGPARDDAGL